MDEAQKKIRDRKDAHMVLAVIAAFVIVVVVGVTAFLRFYNSYIDGVLYQERLSQMKEVTSQLFTGLEDVIQNEWDDVDSFTNYVEDANPQDIQSLFTFMQRQATLSNMDDGGEYLVAVDDMGRYLTQDSWQGTLEEMDLLLDYPERLSFVSKSLTSNQTYMYFLERLSEPVVVQDGERTVSLIYYGTAKDMTQLNNYFTCDAYDNSNSVYVLDQQGSRLFRSSSLIEGYNAYSVLENMDYLHGHSFENAKAGLDATGYGYANAVLNGEEYYYALYQMDHAEWVLLFLVPSSYVATNVVSMVNTTVRLILMFAVALLVIAAALIYLILHVQQNRAMEVERRTNERLTEALKTAERAEQEARKANRAKTDFLSNMSHDIRTPMNAIVGITRLMEHDKADPAKMDAYISKVQQSSQHLLSLINDVLDMSKIESDAVVLNREQVSLAEQVGQVKSILQSQVEERDQLFAVRAYEITHEHLIGDAVRLRQVLINLLSNAVKYTPAGGKILLEIAEEPCDTPNYARIRIDVTDNGAGMTPEFMAHIFEPFTRAENSTTNRVQGTGLGMAITKNIVDLMGGTITVQSELNQGSRFEVIIPMEIDVAASVEMPCSHVLLIGSEENLVKNVRAAFRVTDVPLSIADSGAEVDAVLAQGDVDVILLGMCLHGQKLADAVFRLREKAANAQLIYCCDFEEHEQLEHLMERGGIDAVLARPFFLSILAQTISLVRNTTAAPEEESASVLSGMRFLCAEDNVLNAEILQAVLDMKGAECVICSDGQKLVDAFATVQPGDFDAILMDVQMPVMNGLEATREIRRGKNPLGKTIPIIAMTANAFSEDVQNCLNAGMDAHVAKPLDIEVLERTLKSIMGGKFSGGGTTVRL